MSYKIDEHGNCIKFLLYDEWGQLWPGSKVMKKRKSVKLSVVKDPDLGRRLRINVAAMKGFTRTEVKRYQSAADLLEIVVNTKEFKKDVMTKKFTTTKKTTRQVYDHIMTGEEVLQKGHDYEMDISVVIYEENNNTIGYTYDDTVQTWINRRFFRQYSLGEIACNIFHEWLHKLSYNHASPTDYSSVPYSLGYLVEKMIGDYERGMRYTDLYPTIIKVPAPVDMVEPTGKPPVIVKVPVVVPGVPMVRRCRRFWWTLWLKQTCTYEL